MYRPERCRDLIPEKNFLSNTRAQVAVVKMSHLEPAFVRKKELLVTKDNTLLDTSQPVAVFIDHVKFNHGAQLVAVSRCEKSCIGVCNYSPLIDGKSLEQILEIDQKGISQVSLYRKRLLTSMKEGGYFNQVELGSPSVFYTRRFGKNTNYFSKDLQLNNLKINGSELRSVAVEAYLFLVGDGLSVPLGIFPNDLNLTNILYRHSDDALRVIDQCMSFTSPAVVFDKLLVGWRGLAILGRDKVDWSKIPMDLLTPHLDETLELDKQHIRNCLTYYDWQEPQILVNLQREIAAVQIVKTYLTLIHYHQNSTLPPQPMIDEIIGPFFLDSCSSFFN